MSGEPDIHEVARQLAVLEERMETRQAQTESALDRLRADMATRETKMSEMLAMLTERHATARWWQTAILSGVIAAVGGIVTAIILAAT
ncbi:MAG: hypothetical protein F4Z77_13150 [Dehalococcoidia bacterium]|nr:hypothetical protein [Dehalococcoidia bacterium]MYA53577.1 hypothetical protein [Dehalococcoidia bacterium]